MGQSDIRFIAEFRERNRFAAGKWMICMNHDIQAVLCKEYPVQRVVIVVNHVVWNDGEGQRTIEQVVPKIQLIQIARDDMAVGMLLIELIDENGNPIAFQGPFA